MLISKMVKPPEVTSLGEASIIFQSLFSQHQKVSVQQKSCPVFLSPLGALVQLDQSEVTIKENEVPLVIQLGLAARWPGLELRESKFLDDG